MTKISRWRIHLDNDTSNLELWSCNPKSRIWYSLYRFSNLGIRGLYRTYFGKTSIQEYNGVILNELYE